MGINPIHFNGVDVPSLRDTICGEPWTQYDWQYSDRVSIEQVVRAIQQAEQRIEQQVGCRLLPSWEVNEVQQTIRTARPELTNLSSTDIRGYAQIVKVNWGHFIAGGVRATELLDEDSDIVYSDEDLDGYKERATVTVTGVDADLDVCQVFITPPNEPKVKIRPITATLSATTLTIVFERHQAVKTADLERYSWEAIDGADDTRFLSVVDVYREYNDNSVNATLLWEKTGETATASLGAHGNPKFSYLSYRRGTFESGAWNYSDGVFCDTNYQPDKLMVSYYAGYQDKLQDCPYQQMAPELENVIAQYACTFLERQVCQCKGFVSLLEKYTRDLAFQSGVAEDMARYQIDDTDLKNPLGTQYGAIQAWRWIQNWRHRVT